MGHSRMRLRRVRAVLALMFGSLLLSGCQFDVYTLPLPGGTDPGKDAITVKVQFQDVLDLVPRSAVKYNEVNIGQVTGIELGGEKDRTAIVTLAIKGDTGLPADTTASIRQTSLLGEKFVSLADPSTATETDSGESGTTPVGSDSADSNELLADGDVIPLSRSGRNPEIEEVLGALSLILNGGGVAQLKTITNEVNVALEGREETAKSVLNEIETLVGQLDDRKADITRALSALNRLSKGVRRQQTSIDTALEKLPGAADSLNRQRGDLVRMLQALNRLGNVGVRVIKQTKGITIDALRQLTPVLTQLNRSGSNLAYSLQSVVFPFVDASVGKDPQVARRLDMGDYINLSIEVDVDLANPQLPSICIEELAATPCEEIVDTVLDCISNPDLAKCAGNIVQGVCEALPIPGLECPGGNTGGGGNARGGNAGGGNGGGGLPDLPDLPDLGGLNAGGLGLNRAPVGSGGSSSPMTLEDLGSGHDPTWSVLLGAPLVVGGEAR